MNRDEFENHYKSLQTRDGEVAYVDIGEGPPALFVHGVFLSSYLWRHIIDGLRDMRRCLAIDLPAHGRTRMRPGADMSLPAMSELLEEFCATLNLESVDVIGNDTGGGVAQIFAARHPERLRRLVLTNCDSEDNVPPENFKAGVDLAQRGELGSFVGRIAGDLDAARSDAGLGMAYENGEALSEEAVEAYLGHFADPEAAGELDRFVTSLSADDMSAATAALRQLTVPTLIVWGTGDQFFELNWAYRLRDIIPGASEVVEIEGARLFFPDERSADLLPHLRRHLSAQTSEAVGAGRTADQKTE